MSKRHSRSRRKALAGVGVTLLVVLLAGVGIAWAYINNINHRLTSSVTEETRATLTDVADGETFYMLLLGIDKDEGRTESAEYGASDSNYRSDSIMVARIDPKNRKVTLLSLHRDTRVTLGSHGVQKINAAFTFGGAPYTIETISDFVGVDISHYAEIDMDGLAAVVDAVGGIDVDLPTDVIDPEYTGLNLAAGEQHIDGETAALLCRARHAYDSYGDGDLYRAANQRLVIRTVIERVLDCDPVTMTATLTAMADMITTDLDVGAIITLANQMRGIDIANDIMTGMEPTEGVYENETWYEEPTAYWETMKQHFRNGERLYDGSAYDPTAGVAAELTNGRDSGELPPATTTTSEETSSDSTTSSSSSSSSDSYDSSGYDESYDSGYYDDSYYDNGYYDDSYSGNGDYDEEEGNYYSESYY
jgi:LCP family protein required for cell wall assembly